VLGVHDVWITVGILSTASGVEQRHDGIIPGYWTKGVNDDRADGLSDRNLISNLAACGAPFGPSTVVLRRGSPLPSALSFRGVRYPHSTEVSLADTEDLSPSCSGSDGEVMDRFFRILEGGFLKKVVR
jgi:hypothetical protein